MTLTATMCCKIMLAHFGAASTAVETDRDGCSIPLRLLEGFWDRQEPGAIIRLPKQLLQVIKVVSITLAAALHATSSINATPAVARRHVVVYGEQVSIKIDASGCDPVLTSYAQSWMVSLVDNSQGEINPVKLVDIVIADS
ncbi:hypothetical protein BGZ58_003522 [Dissophora ornata]|nr:hypothetical protein BGZ58_003522 [Dissophora ornata]